MMSAQEMNRVLRERTSGWPKKACLKWGHQRKAPSPGCPRRSPAAWMAGSWTRTTSTGSCTSPSLPEALPCHWSKPYLMQAVPESVPPRGADRCVPASHSGAVSPRDLLSDTAVIAVLTFLLCPPTACHLPTPKSLSWVGSGGTQTQAAVQRRAERNGLSKGL